MNPPPPEVAPQDVAVVGAGIVGLAHAWSAAQRGHRVTVFDRSPRAQGASIRNFGMIWPIGQPAELHAIALQSRARWLQLAEEARIWVNRCGALHLAHRPDEWAVLQEFEQQAARLGYECALLGRDEVLRKTGAANPAGLLGGLYSPTELGVNPRRAVGELPQWLARRYGVKFEFGAAVVEVDVNWLRCATGGGRRFQRIVCCSGADFSTLFPKTLSVAGLKRCKLQMLKTFPQASGWRLGPHLASGLTLRHYANFQICPSLAALRARIAAETPELDELGIHVMASQNEVGEVILGDSHEYEAAIEPFDKTRIDDLLLRELRKVFHLPDWSIAERWHGIYAKHPEAGVFDAEPLPGVYLCTGVGGAGMTMAFGLAERMWQRWTKEQEFS